MPTTISPSTNPAPLEPASIRMTEIPSSTRITGRLRDTICLVAIRLVYPPGRAVNTSAQFASAGPQGDRTTAASGVATRKLKLCSR